MRRHILKTYSIKVQYQFLVWYQFQTDRFPYVSFAQGTTCSVLVGVRKILSRDHHKWRFLKCGYPHIIKKIIGFFVVNHRLWGTPNLRNPQISWYPLEPLFLRICLYSQDGGDGAEEPTEDLLRMKCMACMGGGLSSRHDCASERLSLNLPFRKFVLVGDRGLCA